MHPRRDAGITPLAVGSVELQEDTLYKFIVGVPVVPQVRVWKYPVVESY